MIDEKLEQARRRSAKRRTQLAIIIIATFLLCGIVFFFLSTVELSPLKKNPPAAVPKTGLSEQEREQIRTEVKELLQTYNNDVEPRLQSVNVDLWDREAWFAITELKKKVLADFSGGEYRLALDNLHLLKDKADSLLAAADRIYQENLTQASAFLAQDLYHEAKFHIEKALFAAPQSADALQLQKEIEKLPSLLPLFDEAKVARAENDQAREAVLLQQILQIAPERGAVAERLKEVTDQLNRKKFAAHIASGFAGVKNSQAKVARDHYREAKKIDPARPELAELASRIAALETSLQATKALEAADLAIRRDDWLQARREYSSALQAVPGNKTAIDGLRLADQILQLQEHFSLFFKNPYRLANPDTHHQAEQALDQAATLASYSFAVKNQAGQLRELMSKVNRPVPVTVISDNKTSVSVRSVGRVGVISQKTIQLKPGNYTFEGVRTGYKSKLIRMTVPIDTDVLSVQVICDEPI